MKTKNLVTSIILYLISSLIALAQNIENKGIKPDSILEIQQLDTNTTTKSRKLFEGYNMVKVNDDSIEYHVLRPEQDSIKQRPSGSTMLKDNIEYNAKDSTIYSIDGKKVYLFGEAMIKYEDIELKAHYIEVDMENNILYAEGVPDSLGNIVGQPDFSQGGENMKAKSITYNVKTQKGYIKGLFTQQEEGYLHSESTKKDPNNYINLQRGKYTTCDLEHPHFYVALTRGKVIPNKAIVAGYSYMVMGDVPLYPIMVPFGFFPTTKEKASGFIIPKFGEETERGFYLRNGGYYFALSDYYDLSVTGDVYTNGSWLVNAQSKYKLKYKFSGNFDLAYSKMILGEPGLEDYSETNQYRVKWTHSQDPKARPNSNFSANVNFVSQYENKYNSTSTEDYLSNTTSSSVSYQKTFANTPFSTSMNLRHNQNNKTGDVQLTLPQMTFNMSRIFPFRKKVPVGKTKWYENLGITYTGNFENKSDGLTDSTIFTPQMWDFFENGIQHQVPLNTSLKILKYLNLTPGINFTDRMYFERNVLEEQEYTTSSGEVRDTVVSNLEKGFYNVYDYSVSAGLGTTFYGMYTYNSNWLKAIRHVATPSVSFSYRPDFQNEKYGYYYQTPGDTTGSSYYSPYAGAIYGVPGTGKSGMLNFSLNNNIEMKVAAKNDTANALKKVKILDGLSFSTSYNLMADSMNWSPLNMSTRTTLFKVLNITMSAVGNFYALNSAGKAYNEYHFKTTGQLMRLVNARISTGFSLNSKTFDKKGSGTEPTTKIAPTEMVNNNPEMVNNNNYVSDIYGNYGYNYFEVPWSINIQYSLGYSKTGLVKDINQSLTFSGDFSLTPMWKIGYQSGFDFEALDFTYTSFNLSRDLHCWIATLSVVPFGPRQSYNFSIGAKSSVLADLKYNKNQSWIDNAY